MKKINVLVADDHTLFRKGLINILNQSTDIHVVAEAAHGFEVLKKVSEGIQIDVILMDLNMPQLDGLETLKRLTSRGFAIPVVMVSMEYFELRVIQLIRLGAKGYILKEADPEEVKDAIRTVARSGFFFNNVVNLQFIEKMNSRDSEEPMNVPNITEREYEFLSLLCSDLSYKQIAEKMGVSDHTVDGYRDELFDKLNIKSRVGLAVYAVKNGILSPNASNP